ncbi:MAG: hypothetical protein KAT65_26995 [Methanophagales archaeon]|nr:hypothetical protein [Methanophagales archaeon]
MAISGDRERKIAEIIREYSKGDVDRDWLINKNKDVDNVFKKSFNAIWDYTGDFDLSLWYLAFGQSFGGNAELMHRKIADMCTKANKDLIMLKKDIPKECPYYGSKDATIKSILAINFNNQNKEEIKETINNLYKSEKFGHADKWCRLKTFKDCKHKAKCPVSEWIDLINRCKLRFRNEPKIFFYYDTLCLLNNSKIRNFNELFSGVNTLTKDRTKRTVIIKSILDQIRGISTKSLLFLQMENLFNERDFNDYKLIFVDRLACRVAERIDFPFYQHNLVVAIRKFGESYNLTARQIDFGLWEMGFVCTAEECLHGVEGKKCIFYDVCSWDGKRH